MNVLLLTDFSNNACESHKYAFNLLKTQQVNYFLAHASLSKKIPLEKNNTEASNTQQLDKVYHQLTYFLEDNCTLSRIIEDGNLLDVVRKHIQLLDIDLVVMGARGGSTQLNTSLGKNTYEIATKVKCPVLIVPENTPVIQPKKVSFPVDYKDQLHRKCISKIQSLPQWDEMEITIHELNSAALNPHQLHTIEVLSDTLKLVQPKFSPMPKMDYGHLTQASDLILLVAKNIGVCNAIFHQLDHSINKAMKPVPLLILHA